MDAKISVPWRRRSSSESSGRAPISDSRSRKRTIDRIDPRQGGPTRICDAATPPMLAWLPPKPPPDIAALTPSAECLGASKISAPPRPNRCSWLVSPSGSLCGACQLGVLLIPGYQSDGAENRRQNHHRPDRRMSSSCCAAAAARRRSRLTQPAATPTRPLVAVARCLQAAGRCRRSFEIHLADERSRRTIRPRATSSPLDRCAH
jgi:hypothetical protein